jgi:hypothetical protein
MGGGKRNTPALPPPPKPAENDLLDDPAMRNRAHEQFRLLAMQGLKSTFLTSLRGTEGPAGAGLQKQAPDMGTVDAAPLSPDQRWALDHPVIDNPGSEYVGLPGLPPAVLNGSRPPTDAELRRAQNMSERVGRAQEGRLIS